MWCMRLKDITQDTVQWRDLSSEMFYFSARGVQETANLKTGGGAVEQARGNQCHTPPAALPSTGHECYCCG